MKLKKNILLLIVICLLQLAAIRWYIEFVDFWPGIKLGEDHLLPLDARWQNVSHTERPNTLFVFSAHYERRAYMPRSLRVIGAVKMDDVPSALWCHLWFKTQPSQSVPVFASIEIIHEHANRTFAACFIVCHLAEHMLIPHSVSIVDTLRSVPLNRLLVVDNYQQLQEKNMTKQIPGKLALCVKPIFDYHETVHIIEFIELYSILGVEHFTLYDNNTDLQIPCVLKEYVTQGRVTLIPWELNIPPGQEIKDQGMHASLNDCVLRNLYRYSNVVMVDLDEFLIPSNHTTLVQLIEFLDGRRFTTNPTGSYNFQNDFFFRDRENDPSVVPNNHLETQFLTISKTKRDRFINPHGIRSKYICKPEWTLESGNHFVWRFVSDQMYGLNVRRRFGKSHHYRTCDDWVNCTGGEYVIDQTTYRYKEQLLENVLKAVNTFSDKCGLEGMI